MVQIVIIHDVHISRRGTSAAPVAERRQLRQALKERRTVALWRELGVGRRHEPDALLASTCRVDQETLLINQYPIPI